MRSLLMIVLSSSLIQTPTFADTLPVNCQKQKADCESALEAADAVIQKQSDLIDLIKIRNDDLFKEKTDLQSELLDAQAAKVRADDHNIIWGVVGLAVGALATGFAMSRMGK